MKAHLQVRFGFLLLALSHTAWAASGAGTSGGTILQIPVGARAIAMGEAFTAQADDLSSLYWNPAGIGLISQSQVSFMHNPLFNNMTYNNAGVGVSMENGGIAGSISHLSYGQIAAYDKDGVPEGDVSANSSVATVGGAWLGENWSAGMTVKGVREALADVTAMGFGADAGVTAIYPKEVAGGTLRAAAVIRNLGSGMKFIQQTDPLPREWRVGLAAVQMLRRRMNLSLDYGQVRASDGAVYAGMEYWVIPFIALRTGYSGADHSGSALRAGIGLRFKDLSFDFAHSSYGDLGAAYRYELSLRFGAVNSRLSPEARKLLRQAKRAQREHRYADATRLFDAVIEIAPHYQPARSLIKTSMAGYERQENAGAMRFNPYAPNPRTARREDLEEAKELESLLNAGNEAMVQSDSSTSDGLTKENPQ